MQNESEVSDLTGVREEMYPHPAETDRKTLKSFPEYDKYSLSPLEIDLRNCNLSSLRLYDKYDALLRADFDTHTIWPYTLPGNFNPKKIIELGKNPGLGIKQLHKAGITGNGVGIAIIARPPLVGHYEYSGKIKLYSEISVDNPVVVDYSGLPGVSITASSMSLSGQEKASYDGTAIASIIAGRTTGVSPEAVLYYFSLRENDKDDNEADIVSIFNTIALLNGKLPAADRIRAIVIQSSLMKANGTELKACMKKASGAGILVLSNGISLDGEQFYGIRCLGRNPLSDPDSYESYRAGYAWETQFLTYGDYFEYAKKGYLLVPGDTKTTASPAGVKDYVFNRIGTIDYAASYLAGLYALACQADPQITPDSFITAAKDTGSTLTVEKYGLKRVIKYMLNPKSLIKRFRGK